MKNRPLTEIIKKVITELKTPTRYYIQCHPNTGGPPKKVFDTTEFDQEKLQKTFDEYAKKMKVGEILEYGKVDSKRYHPSMLEVEMTEKGLYRTTPSGKMVGYRPKY